MKDIHMKLPCIKGAVFDLDGTLLDSMCAWKRVTENFFDKCGIVLTSEEAGRFTEMTLEESMPYIKTTYGLTQTVDEMLDWFRQSMAEQYKYHIEIKPGAAGFIEFLHDCGVKIGIASSTYAELCEAALARLGVWRYVDAGAYSAEVGVNKENPDVYLLAAKRMGVAPRDCIAFEDIPSGLNGAKKAGMYTCAVKDISNENIFDEIKKHADMYIDTWMDLL